MFVLLHNKFVAKRGSYRADVRIGGDPGHTLGHAHIYRGSKNIASISETGEILAGELDRGARKFVNDYLPQIIDGIRRYYYLGR